MTQILPVTPLLIGFDPAYGTDHSAEVVCSIVGGKLRVLAITTREKGRHYERTRVCPHCFSPFTPKGIARHVAACERSERAGGKTEP